MFTAFERHASTVWPALMCEMSTETDGPCTCSRMEWYCVVGFCTLLYNMTLQYHTTPICCMCVYVFESCWQMLNGCTSAAHCGDHHPCHAMAGVVWYSQILIQLKRFNQTMQRGLSTRARAKGVPGSAGASRGAKTKSAAASPLDQDLGSILGTPESDTAAIDTSVGGAY